MIRPSAAADTDTLVAVADATAMFKPIEIVALREVLDDFHAYNYLDNHHAMTLEDGGEILGFAYYGHVPMTDGTWQLWWIFVRKDQQGRGAGGRLLRFVEDDIRVRLGGRILFVETGSLPHFEPTREFYRRRGYEEHAFLKDFYADDDSMVVFRKVLVTPG